MAVDAFFHLMSPDNHDGEKVWTWELWQEPLEDDIDCVRGSAVTLCSILGIPFVRFRVAVRRPSCERIAWPPQAARARGSDS